MTTEQYIREKNKLVYKATGMVLVPEDQIIDMGYKDTFRATEHLDKLSYPYCLYYFDNDCKGCIMYEKGNGCLDGYSSYERIIEYLENKECLTSDYDIIPGLYELGVKYKESNER
jgi:hypothetical protein